MSRLLRTGLAFAALSLAIAPAAGAAIVYDEAGDGDLSGNGLAPTSISVALGSNEIYGTTGRSAEGIVDRDYFVISVPTGHEIVAMIEKAGTTTVGGVAFLGVQAGTQVTVPVAPVDATGLLGWYHYAAADSDLDILEVLGQGGAGATDFVPPLPAGAYAFWVQDTGTGSASYAWDIVIAVPEPGAAGLVLLACAALARARIRRSNA